MAVRTTELTTDVTIRLVGESGEGTISLGELAARMLTALGLEICTFQTFPAEIKGGTVMFQVRARSGAVYSEGDAANILVALTEDGYHNMGGNLAEDGIVLYDSDVFTPEAAPGRWDLGMPITSMAKAQKDALKAEMEGDQVARLPAPKNIVGLGALLTLINAPLTPAEQYIQDLFGRKGEHIVRMNIRALHAGADRVKQEIGTHRTPHIKPQERETPVITVSGNQMIAMGALAGGLGFFGGYPITPATEIMEFLAKELPRFGGDLIQAEDEIAALGMLCGASYAGKKVMTSTSGPGLSLMVELINFAGQAEIPLVITDVQRGGASTGMPTKTSQGDLNLAVYGVHNESPHIVFAPSSVEDCFWSAIDALNLAETYQCPVILLSDQALATRKNTLVAPDLSKVKTVDRITPAAEDLGPNYRRYLDTATGISAMAIPGTAGGAYTATGIEHDEIGNPGYTPQLAKKMKDKRFRKLETLQKGPSSEYAHVYEYAGEGLADVGIIAFGSTEGVLREAVERAEAEGITTAHLHLRLLAPLPVEQIEAFAAKCKKILVPELNYTGQLAGYLRANTNIQVTPYHKDMGIPFVARELFDQIRALASQN